MYKILANTNARCYRDFVPMKLKYNKRYAYATHR